MNYPIVPFQVLENRRVISTIYRAEAGAEVTLERKVDCTDCNEDVWVTYKPNGQEVVLTENNNPVIVDLPGTYRWRSGATEIELEPALWICNKDVLSCCNNR